MNRYQTLAANTALISIGTFGSKLLVFLMVRFYTGYLTPAEYGTADLITQTANLLIPIASLDVAEGVFRFAADRREQRAEVFTIGVYTMLFAAAALLAALPLLRVLIGERQLGTLLAVFIIAACAHALCAQFIRAEGHTALYALQGLLNTALYLALNVLFLAVFRWGVMGYLLSTVVLHEHAVSRLQGEALAQIPCFSEPDTVAADLLLLRSSHSGGNLLVGDGRVGPVYGKVVFRQRCQRHLRRGI